MLLSRGATILKAARPLNVNKHVITIIRQSHDANWCYRMVPEPRKGWTFVADFLGGLMWWWVFWNFWHESAHITGHFPFPRPADWSDEELGIPAD
ncbi:PREDICTED: NADH dehydrogenase [ubiquinone] 1 beta subcomplex subunit 2, mitochondrial-like [Habropoda laboriosa]|uniref:NADH dehydrogenase [ubiquinone] 1 beta subcomplex subunit 2, mitochondrial-like n=1 Tax=Habropoda laboriosa TaxID=597456 RepID=UPI00083D1B1D|nr:PREDICTED: NADH dehydrogenase [ubiquinone] 1 beta subcomplex subunit 2, mitochondrial-like [Habropoda laboriosa]